MGKLAIIISFLMIAWPGYSMTGSTVSDTTIPVRRNAIANAMAMADSLDIMKRERAALYEIKAMQDKLIEKDSMLIASLDRNIQLAEKLIRNLEGQVANSEKQTGNEKKININLDAIIRKKNWTIVKIGSLSVSIIGGLTYLLLKK